MLVNSWKWNLKHCDRVVCLFLWPVCLCQCMYVVGECVSGRPVGRTDPVSQFSIRIRLQRVSNVETLRSARSRPRPHAAAPGPGGKLPVRERLPGGKQGNSFPHCCFPFPTIWYLWYVFSSPLPLFDDFFFVKLGHSHSVSFSPRYLSTASWLSCVAERRLRSSGLSIPRSARPPEAVFPSPFSLITPTRRGTRASSCFTQHKVRAKTLDITAVLVFVQISVVFHMKTSTCLNTCVEHWPLTSATRCWWMLGKHCDVFTFLS